MFGKSYAISLVSKFVLRHGLEYLEDFTEDKRDEIDSYLRDRLADWIEDRVIDAVHDLLDLVLEGLRDAIEIWGEPKTDEDMDNAIFHTVSFVAQAA